MASLGLPVRKPFVESECARSIDEFGSQRRTCSHEFYQSTNATAAVKSELVGRTDEFEPHRSFNRSKQCDPLDRFLNVDESRAVSHKRRNQPGKAVVAKGRQERAGIEKAVGARHGQRRNQSLVAASDRLGLARPERRDWHRIKVGLASGRRSTYLRRKSAERSDG